MENSSLFNSSILNEKQYSDQDFKTSCIERLKGILRREFKNDFLKQQVKETNSGLNFACPYCGDSMMNSRKKRGWFLLNGKFEGHFKCFNCGKFVSIQQFFKDFNENLDLGSITYLSNHTENLKVHFNNSSNESFFVDKDEAIKLSIRRDVLMRSLNLEEIKKGSKGYKYLVRRNQWNFQNFLYDPNGDYIVILNLIDGIYVLGFQCRDLSGKRKNKYKTVTLQRIHELILRDQKKIPSDLENISTVFNIMNVDTVKPVIVTEGPFDCFLLPNAIASSGASKVIPIDLDFFYLYDNDKTGTEYALKKLYEGYHVFMWQKLKSDLQIPDKKKWDVNDLVNYLRMNKRSINIKWIDYFTNDPLDSIYI